MSSDEPGNHENAKHDIARKLEMKVFEQFCGREDDIHQIHQAQYDSANLALVVTVRTENKAASDDVMREHLRIVFPALFNVDHHNLL